jgi:hypothetical protein
MKFYFSQKGKEMIQSCFIHVYGLNSERRENITINLRLAALTFITFAKLIIFKQWSFYKTFTVVIY